MDKWHKWACALRVSYIHGGDSFQNGSPRVGLIGNTDMEHITRVVGNSGGTNGSRCRGAMVGDVGRDRDVLVRFHLEFVL